MNKYLVVVDSCEKVGWHFEPNEECLGEEIHNLNTGDYTLRGLEDKFIIERKGKIAEFSTNICEKRFDKELERLEGFQWPFMILEFDLMDVILFPKTSTIPKHLWGRIKVTPQFILSRIAYYSIHYKTKIIFAGTNGKTIAQEL